MSLSSSSKNFKIFFQSEIIYLKTICLQVLEKIIGMTTLEFSQKRREGRTNPTVKDQLRNVSTDNVSY